MKSFKELENMSQEGLVATVGNKILTDGERCAALCALQHRFGQKAVDSLVPSPDGTGLTCSCHQVTWRFVLPPNRDDDDDYSGGDNY